MLFYLLHISEASPLSIINSRFAVIKVKHFTESYYNNKIISLKDTLPSKLVNMVSSGSPGKLKMKTLLNH